MMNNLNNMNSMYIMNSMKNITDKIMGWFIKLIMIIGAIMILLGLSDMKKNWDFKRFAVEHTATVSRIKTWSSGITVISNGDTVRKPANTSGAEPKRTAYVTYSVDGTTYEKSVDYRTEMTKGDEMKI